jgi:tight adherence protein B
MVASLTPLLIILSGVVAVGFIFSSVWLRFVDRIRNFGSFYRSELDLADMKIKSQDLGFVVITIDAFVWIGLIILIRPGIIFGLLYLPVILFFSAYGVKMYLQMRIAGNLKKFNDQLENVLRSLASGVRVGLGLRQALLLVAEQSKDPAKKELTRVIGAANLGTGLFDALDEMSKRLPLPETAMLARVIRVQATSGGNLAEILESLADTIKDRRRLQRKVRALISQSRATAWLLGLMPLFICSYIFVAQPTLRDAALTNSIGQISLILGLALDAAAVFFLVNLTKLDA